MKNLFKKVSAILIAAIMVFAMSASVFAATGTMATTHPSADDKATLTITGIATDETPTVTLYKVAEGKYSERGFAGYNCTAGVNLADLENPTEAAISAIAKGILNGTITPLDTITDGTLSNGTYTKEVTGAGAYIAIIAGAAKTVYNPILLGVSYNENSIITTADSVDAGSLYNASAVAKSTKPHIDKTIAGGTTTDGDKETVSVGDVVKYNIESLSGEVEVKSKWGEGSTWTIRLPLTLAIIQALMVVVGGEKYAISLGSIQPIEDISPNDIKLVENKEVINLRGTVIPLIRLTEVLDVESTRSPEDNLIVVIVKKGDKMAGLVIDELIGQQEIVIKSLGKYIKQCKFISGATILGDGEVALILDANALL